MARKRKKGPREKNGRISRAKEPTQLEAQKQAAKDESPADEVALEARAKRLAAQWGIVNVESAVGFRGPVLPKPVSNHEARNPLYGTFTGILHQTGKLSREQYDAGQLILDLRNLEMKRVASESAIYERFGFQSGILSPEEHEARQRAISVTWGAFKTTIQEAQNYHRGNLWAALQYCLYEDQSFPHMLGDLRLALNAAHRFFSTNQKRRAA